MNKYIRLVIVLLLLVTSCKSKKSVTESDVATFSTRKVISNHMSADFNKKTLNARITAKYRDPKSSASFSVRLRMEKDKTIWLSATKFGIPVAKAKITPERVSYYEKLNRTYFDGDFALISKFLGTDLNYEKLQNLLLGQAILDLKKGKYNSDFKNSSYEVLPKKSNELYEILFVMNPENFKLKSQQVKSRAEEQLLAVSYPNYTEIEGQTIPKKIAIRAIDKKNVTTINMEYKTVVLDEELTFPFSIPQGYKELKIE